MVGVRVGAGVLPPARRGRIAAPDLAVPDDVLDAEPAGHRVLVAVLVGLQQPGHEAGDLGAAAGGLGADAPVEGPALLVLRGAADRAGAHDAEAAGGAGRPRAGGWRSPRRRASAGGAGGLRLVAGERLDRGRVVRRGPSDGPGLGGSGRDGQRGDRATRRQQQQRRRCDCPTGGGSRARKDSDGSGVDGVTPDLSAPGRRGRLDPWGKIGLIGGRRAHPIGSHPIGGSDTPSPAPPVSG